MSNNNSKSKTEISLKDINVHGYKLTEYAKKFNFNEEWKKYKEALKKAKNNSKW